MNIFQTIQTLLKLPVLDVAIWGFGSSMLFGCLLVLTQRWHGKFSMDQAFGVQKFHSWPTPRIGGMAIVSGLVVAWNFVDVATEQVLTPLMVASVPAFVFGLAEDVTKRVSVMARLLATMASGLLAWWLTGYAISGVDIWGVDWFFGYAWVSVMFTVFAVGGVANSINIIDGFNGLASSMSALAFLGYAMIAIQVGDTTLAGVALVLAACVGGFFWLNWPFGKLFLGDGGAYFVGFALAWVAVLLIERNLSVSAFAVLLVCAHPVIEVLFSIYRRQIRKHHPGMPDRLHLHSLVKRRYVSRWFGQCSPLMRNSITGVLIGSITLITVMAANLSYASASISALLLLVVCLAYVAVYARMVRHHWCSPLAFLLVKPDPSRHASA